jgi:hypothetical protein
MNDFRTGAAATGMTRLRPKLRPALFSPDLNLSRLDRQRETVRLSKGVH